jgi:hypothetical protein
MVQQTQQLFSEVQPVCPGLGDDKRHNETAKYPFMDYDNLSDDDCNDPGK